MNEKERIENEIKEDKTPELEVQGGQPEVESQKRHKTPTQHLQDTKTTFLLIITLVLGFVSLISLVFVLRLRSQVPQEMSDAEVSQEVTQEKMEELMLPEKVEGRLNIEAELFELDKLGLESVEEDYSFDLLEN